MIEKICKLFGFYPNMNKKEKRVKILFSALSVMSGFLVVEFFGFTFFGFGMLVISALVISIAETMILELVLRN